VSAGYDAAIGCPEVCHSFITEVTEATISDWPVVFQPSQACSFCITDTGVACFITSLKSWLKNILVLICQK
jgi:hypothetical protein